MGDEKMMMSIKNEYLNSVCTRIIAMLSPPSNEDVVSKILSKTSPVVKREVCVVVERKLPWELIISNFLIGALAIHLLPIFLKKIDGYIKTTEKNESDATATASRLPDSSLREQEIDPDNEADSDDSDSDSDSDSDLDHD